MFEQSEKNKNSRLPFGFRDIFPLESSGRDIIRKIIGNEFKSWGYEEIKTPVMEYTENISIGVGKDWKNKLINFLDIDGSLISLRADMTIPIARLAGMRLREEQLPARFCYFSDVFRQAGNQVESKRSFSQAGLEFLGSCMRMEADAEIMMILIRSLNSLGLKDFRMVVGHIGFINGLLDWLGLDEGKRTKFKKNIVDKDFVRIEEKLKGLDRNKTRTFMGLIQPENDLRKISKIVTDIDKKSVSSVYNYIKGLYRILDEQDIGKYLIFDFSVISDFDYYTGILFEVFCKEITGIIGSGGRYDNLIKRFGSDIPSTGFALDIDILLGALGDKALIDDLKIMVVPIGKGKAINSLTGFADSIRDKGVNVEILYDNVKNIVVLAIERNCRFVAEIPSDMSEIKVTDTKNGESQVMDDKTFLEEIKKWKKN